jgi:hypothetical protein
VGESVGPPCSPDERGECELCSTWPGYCPFDSKCSCGCSDHIIDRKGFRCSKCKTILIEFGNDGFIETNESKKSAYAKE